MQKDLSYITKEYIEQEHVVNKKSFTKIAKEIRVCRATLIKYVKSIGVNVKPANESENLLGRQFNHLTVIGVVENKNNRKGYKIQWRCICDCPDKNIIILPTCRLKTQLSCGCKCSNKVKGSQRKTWKGCGQISGNYFGIIRRQAEGRDIEFNISVEYIWNLFVLQNGKCALTGQDLCFAETNTREKYGDRTASLDRIDPNKGYIKGNVWWTHKDVNRMRWILEVKEFVNMCDMVVKNKNTIQKTLNAIVDGSIDKAA